MHHPTLGLDALGPRLLRLVGELGNRERRAEVANLLARELGAARLFLFAPDPELQVALPAPGLPQVLRGAADWRVFLDRCARDGSAAATVTLPDGSSAPARGCALPNGTAAVLVGVRPAGLGPEPLLPFLPLLGALFGLERQVAAEAARARAAAEAVERARTLTSALQLARERLQAALDEAEAARAAARERAEHAEELAGQLHAQAEQLQQQARAMESLNQELVARTEEAERQRLAAESASRAKSDFLATMSHELRTPINAVIGYSELLAMGVSGPISEHQQVQLERIRASSAHLLGLVNDVLDLARVEAGQFSVCAESAPLAPVVGEAIAVVMVAAGTAQVELVNTCEDSRISLWGDQNRVRQIVVNLLANAIKFTDAGGRVRVHCQLATGADAPAELEGPGPWACVTVEDTGIGIPPGELTRIFLPFVQVDATRTRRHGGTGLGLTISRKLANLMGGELTVRSEAGLGSRFSLWLPTPPADG